VTTDTQAPETQAPTRTGRPSLGSLARSLLADRVALLAVLLVVLLAWMFTLSAGGYLVAPYDLSYMASALESMVPLAILGLAQLLVIVSGRGGIDLSVGAMVSLVGMLFGFAYGMWEWPLLPSLLLALAAGVVLGAINGLLVAYLRVPALIATLATYYAYSSLALISNDNAPISTRPLQELNSITRAVDLGGLAVPRQVFTFLLPVAVLTWLLVNRAPYGRKLYAVGTNETAARYASLDVARIRFGAYTLSGLLSAVVALVTAAQFASARPDAGTVGNGMALPAITIAVLGGVAIAGGVGRVGGVLVAALLIVWLNAGILLYFEGPQGSQYQLLALGAVLLASALFNAVVLRRRGAT
jgi:ribose/xylose/arabinose/galactoside ABC-type transport system permease subunit